MSGTAHESRRVPEHLYETEQVAEASWVARCKVGTCRTQTAKKGSERRTIGPIEDHIRVKHANVLTG